ncbi:uncharacterized protein LOC115760961 isoform X1 [Drosophila novamexicana]|uniref:uncharacterized protein LOC115760961 isoform X1 n=1 Tax=Drosophila novamexicana TaxID=47314 RepID=UPI0011E5B3A1|nr:uncharacterized protein LOC115760961 isoform X1 [Drosophila novamexicana]
MCSNRRNAQIGIGLSVMGLSLLSNPFFSPDQRDLLNFVLPAQLTATVALIYGVLRAHAQHKAKFLLFWLGISSAFFSALLYASLFTFLDRGWNYFFYYIDNFLSLLPASGIGYMMHLIYKDYVELTLGAVTELKQPPPYDGSAEKIDISIKT